MTKSMKLSRAPYSVHVLRVESKQSEQQQSKTARKHEGDQAFKLLERKVREQGRKIIAANNNYEMSQRDETNKFVQIAASEIIEKLRKKETTSSKIWDRRRNECR